MTKLSTSWTAVARLTCAAVTICAMSGAMAKVEGVTGTAFTLVAKSGYISIADGASIYNWGYALRNADGSANFQYPGPTLIVNQGDVVEITLINELPTNVSLLFPGQIDVTTAQISNADAPSGCTASGNANRPTWAASRSRRDRGVASSTASLPASQEPTPTTAARRCTCSWRWDSSAR